MKYYVVKKGRQTGIFLTWPECQEQIKGYSGAVFKSFIDLDTAQEYFNEKEPDKAPINNGLPEAYIDGSNSKKNACYGYGGYLIAKSEYHIIQGKGNNPEFLPEKNIAGELTGALQVVFTCQKLQVSEVNLFFDYAGIENYINGSWEAKTPLALYYKQAMELTADKVKVNFYQVKGHTGIQGNEIADLLAKEAVGAQLRKKDLVTLQDFRKKAAEPFPGTREWYDMQPWEGFSTSATYYQYKHYISQKTEPITKRLVKETLQAGKDNPAADLGERIRAVNLEEIKDFPEHLKELILFDWKHINYEEIGEHILKDPYFTGKGA